MNISLSFLKKIAVVYLTLPLVIFLAGWIRPFISVPLIFLVLFSLYQGFFSKKESDSFLSLSKTCLFALAGIILFWGFVAGQAGFFYQSSDYQFRNAVFRDLILLPWPVQYAETNAVLVYYIGHWLPSALLAKTLFLISSSAKSAWIAGNVFLWIWGAVGVFLTSLFLIDFCKAFSGKTVSICMLIFIFFSGMDIIGALIVRQGLAWHLEWWTNFYQYSSLTTCMFWVFNQTIAPWLIVMLVLHDKNVGEFGFLGTLCLFSAPFPFLGLLPYLFVIASIFIWQEKGSFFQRIKPFFTAQNLVFMSMILPILCFYFSMTTATGNTTSSFPVFWRASQWPEFLSFFSLLYLAFFLFLEYGALALMLTPFYKKNPLFLTAVFLLTFLPFIQIGTSGDFLMRSSVPSLFILMVLTAKIFVQKQENSDIHDVKILKTGIMICLFLGAFTPGIEWTRAFYFTAQKGIKNVVADDIKTLQPYVGKIDLKNFVRLYADDTFFVKHLMR